MPGIFNIGTKSKGICDNCKKIVTTTFRKIPIKDREDQACSQVLRGCCDECGEIISIPHKSK